MWRNFSELDKTMVLVSDATGAAEGMEEQEKMMALKPVTLPGITMTLKRA